MNFQSELRKVLAGGSSPHVTETKLLDDFSAFLSIFYGMIQRLPAAKEQELLAPEALADRACERFQEITNGMPRAHVWMAVAMLVGATVDEWKAEEKLLTGPVQ